MKLANCKFCNIEIKINKYASIKKSKCEKCKYKRQQKKSCMNCSKEFIAGKGIKNCSKKCVSEILSKKYFKSNEKRKLTCIKRYSEEYPNQNEEIKEKIKKSCLKRYGYEYSIQYYNKEIRK